MNYISEKDFVCKIGNPDFPEDKKGEIQYIGDPLNKIGNFILNFSEQEKKSLLSILELGNKIEEKTKMPTEVIERTEGLFCLSDNIDNIEKLIKKYNRYEIELLLKKYNIDENYQKYIQDTSKQEINYSNLSFGIAIAIGEYIGAKSLFLLSEKSPTFGTSRYEYSFDENISFDDEIIRKIKII